MPTSKDISILIVDDYKSTLRIMRTLLKQLGFDNVEEALSVDEALKLTQVKDFGLVLCDWNMMPRTGFDLLCALNDNDGYNKPPFVMITAANQEKEAKKALEAGANGQITKPFKASTLRSVLANVFTAA